MIPDLRWLRSFLAVAEERHFSRAARRLNLAQPALTAQIRKLEDAVGATLFERTNRTRGLTAAGLALLPEAEALVERAEGLARMVRSLARGGTGPLRLGLIPPAATAAVAGALRRFALATPEVEILVRQGNQDRLENGLLDGDLDLMLGRAPENPALSHRRLFHEQQGILLPVDDPLAVLASIPLSRLAGRRLLLLRGNPHFGQNLLDLARRHRVHLTPSHAAEDFPSLHWLVRAGLGIAPCSLLLADTLPAGLVARALRPAPPRHGIHALWRGRLPPPPATRWLRCLEDLTAGESRVEPAGTAGTAPDGAKPRDQRGTPLDPPPHGSP